MCHHLLNGVFCFIYISFDNLFGMFKGFLYRFNHTLVMFFNGWFFSCFFCHIGWFFSCFFYHIFVNLLCLFFRVCHHFLDFFFRLFGVLLSSMFCFFKIFNGNFLSMLKCLLSFFNDSCFMGFFILILFRWFFFNLLLDWLFWLCDFISELFSIVFNVLRNLTLFSFLIILILILFSHFLASNNHIFNFMFCCLCIVSS